MKKQIIVSLIIPIRNESKYLRQLLESIANQDYPSDNVEIIFADGMSSDDSRQIIMNYFPLSSNTKIINNPDKIVAQGFNRALNLCKGDIIIRVDGHCKLPENFIQKIIFNIEEKNVVCSGGIWETIGETLIGKAIALATSSKFGVGNASYRIDNKNLISGKFVDTVAFGGYKREVFTKIGGYDEELVRNQDDEFSFRMIQNGMKIWMDPEIVIKYYSRATFFKLFKQYFQYGTYKIRVLQKRRSIATFRQLIPAAFVLCLILSVAIFFLTDYKTLSCVIPGFYLSINVAISLSISNVNPLKAVLISISFVILHLSYGLGYLFGFYKFRKKWHDRILKDSHFDRIKFSKLN